MSPASISVLKRCRCAAVTGKTSPYLLLHASPGASEIAVADDIYDRVAEINKVLPDDLELIVAFDVSNYMRDSLREIVTTLGETILLVGFVVVALMGSLRTALVPLLTIPISLLGSRGDVVNWVFIQPTHRAGHRAFRIGSRRCHCRGRERRPKSALRHEPL